MNYKLLKPGFTFVEIIISITILALISFVWVSSFQKFFSSSQITAIKTKFTNQINSEKNDLLSWKITSYRITFNSWAKALFISEDFYKNSNLISFDIADFNSFSWKIVTNNASNWTWYVNTYLDNILYQSELKNFNSWYISFNLSGNKTFQTYVVNSTVDDISTNNLKIFRLDYSWLDDNMVRDTIISTLSWANLYNKVSLENIMWNKRVLVNSWWVDIPTNDEIITTITRWAEDFSFKIDK